MYNWFPGGPEDPNLRLLFDHADQGGVLGRVVGFGAIAVDGKIAGDA